MKTIPRNDADRAGTGAHASMPHPIPNEAEMSPSRDDQAVIAREDLDIVVAAVTARLPRRDRESQRLARVGELLKASSELARLPTAQTKHALIDAHGSLGAGDLAAHTDDVFDALERYAALVHDVAMEYRYLVMSHELAPDASGERDLARLGPR